MTATNYRLSSDPAPKTADYSRGAFFIFHESAPNPSTFLPNPEVVAAAINSKQTTREKRIQEILNSNPALERFEAAMKHDFEDAPRSTNLKQLAEMGIILPTIDELPNLTDEEVNSVMWRIIYGLATLNIFVTETDPFSDRDVVDRLLTSVLVDEIADIAPSSDMTEFIAINQQKDSDTEVVRDHLLPRPDRRS